MSKKTKKQKTLSDPILKKGHTHQDKKIYVRVCPTCAGWGDEHCPTCYGEGVIEETKH